MIEHGCYTVKFEKNVLYLKIIGPCNKETFERYNAEISKRLHLQVRNLILELSYWKVSVLWYRKYSVVREKTGLTNLALYIHNSQSPLTIKEQVKLLYKGLTVNYSFHETLDSAIIWLQSLNTKIDKELLKRMLWVFSSSVYFCLSLIIKLIWNSLKSQMKDS